MKFENEREDIVEESTKWHGEGVDLPLQDIISFGR